MTASVSASEPVISSESVNVVCAVNGSGDVAANESSDERVAASGDAAENGARRVVVARDRVHGHDHRCLVESHV